MSFVEINGINLYYEIHGHGAPLLLLHHGFGCTKMWNKILPQLVDSGYKPICYDRRGFGRSEEGPDFLDFYVSDAFMEESISELESFRDWLGLDSFYVVGQCEGGVSGRALCGEISTSNQEHGHIKHTMLQRFYHARI